MTAHIRAFVVLDGGSCTSLVPGEVRAGVILRGRIELAARAPFRVHAAVVAAAWALTVRGRGEPLATGETEPVVLPLDATAARVDVTFQVPVPLHLTSFEGVVTRAVELVARIQTSRGQVVARQPLTVRPALLEDLHLEPAGGAYRQRLAPRRADEVVAAMAAADPQIAAAVSLDHGRAASELPAHAARTAFLEADVALGAPRDGGARRLRCDVWRRTTAAGLEPWLPVAEVPARASLDPMMAYLSARMPPSVVAGDHAILWSVCDDGRGDTWPLLVLPVRSGDAQPASGSPEGQDATRRRQLFEILRRRR